MKFHLFFKENSTLRNLNSSQNIQSFNLTREVLVCLGPNFVSFCFILAVDDKQTVWTGADLEGGGGGGKRTPPLPHGFDPLPTQRVPPLILFQKSIFGRPTLKFFLKAPLAPIYSNFEGERAPKKTRFFCNIFSKSAQKRLFWLFFQKFACGPENFAKIGAKQSFGRARKINLVDLKKKVVKILENFLKIRPPPSRKS